MAVPSAIPFHGDAGYGVLRACTAYRLLQTQPSCSVAGRRYVLISNCTGFAAPVHGGVIVRNWAEADSRAIISSSNLFSLGALGSMTVALGKRAFSALIPSRVT